MLPIPHQHCSHTVGALKQPSVCVQNAEGRQLSLEAVALVGALLLALDRRTDGAVRERSVVAYYRLKGGAQARPAQH